MLMNSKKAAEVLNVSQQMVRKLIHEKKISARRNMVNGRFEILQDSVMKYRNNRRYYQKKAREAGFERRDGEGVRNGWYINGKRWGVSAKKALENYENGNCPDYIPEP